MKPSFSITRRDWTFSTVVKLTTSSSGRSTLANAHSTTARAASVAKPLPHCWRAKRQPTSTHGVNHASHAGEESITIPASSPLSSRSTAHPP